MKWVMVWIVLSACLLVMLAPKHHVPYDCIKGRKGHKCYMPAYYEAVIKTPFTERRRMP
jgi:hypothetical protein